MIGTVDEDLISIAIALVVCGVAFWVTPRGERRRHAAWVVPYLSLVAFCYLDVLAADWPSWVDLAEDMLGTTLVGAALARFAQARLARDHGLGRTILISGAISLAGQSLAWPMGGLSGDLVQSLAIVAASIWPMMDRRTPAGIRKSLDCATMFAAQVLFAVWVFGADSIQRAGGIEEGVDLVLVALIGVAALATELRIALKEKHDLAEAEAHARRDLESTTSLLRGILDYAPAAIYKKDLDGRYLLTNQSIHQWTGKSGQELLGSTDHQLFDKDIADRITELDRAALESRGGEIWELELPPMGGNPARWVLSHRFPLRDAAGRIEGLGGLVIDITRIKEFERELMTAKMAAEAASHTKSNFLAQMSHELRTPLNAIIGFSEIIHDRMLGPDAHDSYAEYAGDILRAGRILLAEVDVLLDISRIEAGKLEVMPRQTALAGIVSEALRILRDQAMRRAIDIRVVGEPLPGAWCDARATVQVLVNLVGNAIKYIQEGGTITIAAEIGGDGAARLSVADNGPGIKPTMMESLLDPWSRRSAMESTSSGRIGMGLMISRKLMKLQGGDLRLRSEDGKGTVATCEFAPPYRQAGTALAASA